MVTDNGDDRVFGKLVNYTIYCNLCRMLVIKLTANKELAKGGGNTVVVVFFGNSVTGI